MIKEDYFVDVDIVNVSMMKYYIEKGYDIKFGDIVKVKSIDLPKASRKEVKFICDYCGDEFIAVLKTRNGNMKKQIIKKDACQKCRNKKVEESNLIKYGVKNVFQNEEIKDRHKKTLLNKYGVEHTSQIDGFAEKCKNTSLKRYGVEHYTKTEEFSKRCKETWINKTDEEINIITNKRRSTMLKKYGKDNPLKVKSIKLKMMDTNIDRYGYKNVFQNEKIKDKSKETNIKKYGTEYYSQTDEGRERISEAWRSFSDDKISEIINKRKQTSLKKYGTDSYTKTDEYIRKTINTNMQRYGVKYSIQNNQVRAKAYKTFVKNGSIPCSSQQKYLYDLLGGELNYFTGRCFLDIAFPNDMIYIEYDGGGHDLDVKLGNLTQEEFNRKETKRYFALKNEGWKMIRIKSSYDKMPVDIEIVALIERSKKLLDKYNWVEINIDEAILKVYDYVENLDLKLRRIYKDKEVC